MPNKRRGEYSRHLHQMLMALQSKLNRGRRPVVAIAVVVVLALCYIFFSSSASSGECLISMGRYTGPVYRAQETISNDRCLVGSRWMQLRQHTLRSPADSVIDDWLFIDYHDRVNVLAEIGGEFQVMRQKKYALEDRSSLAVVGGIIEPGRDVDAAAAARRELAEEIGLMTQELVPLGRFRTDVNRGMGWVNAYLARNCQPVKLAQEFEASSGGSNSSGSSGSRRLGQRAKEEVEGEVGEADAEYQRPLRLTLQQLREEVRKGSFLEVQWSNTVALAVLHLTADP